MFRATLIVALLMVTAQAQARCRLALALGLDISSSVDSREYALQLGGLVQAFRADELIAAMLSPKGSDVAVTVYEWSGYNQQDIAVGWTVLDSPGAARDFAARLGAHRRPYTDLSTALGKAVEYGATLLKTAPACTRRVLDISGDGANNDGAGPGDFRRRGLLEGVTINGLAIRGDLPDPALYYADNVVQGPDAFVAIARDFDDFPPVMLRKLLREVSGEMIMGGLP